MPSRDNTPIEASYESAKQSIINYIGEVSRIYDLPMLLINNLIYEIALEARNASFSAVMGGCEITYPEQKIPDDIPTNVSANPNMTPGHHSMPKDQAFEEFKKMGINVNDQKPVEETPEDMSA